MPSDPRIPLLGAHPDKTRIQKDTWMRGKIDPPHTQVGKKKEGKRKRKWDGTYTPEGGAEGEKVPACGEAPSLAGRSAGQKGIFGNSEENTATSRQDGDILMPFESMVLSNCIIFCCLFPPPTFSPSQAQGLFQLVRSLHQVAKVLECQCQHQFLQ